jgi:pyruvate kinase
MANRRVECPIVQKTKKETRVVVSLGPTLGDEDAIAAAIALDADFRQPFGYRVQDHFAQFAILERLRKKLGKPAQVYVDLPSERPRIGRLEADLHVQPGRQVRVCAVGYGDAPDVVPVPALARFLPALQPGHRLLIRDGHTVLRILAQDNAELIAQVESTIESIASNNNVMFPDSAVLFEPIVEDDHRLLEAYRQASFAPEWIMLSLVTSIRQVAAARSVLAGIFGERAPRLMVKIETAKSVEQMCPLLDACDGLLVGRGDLGMTMPPEMIPAIQEDAVRACRQAGKPVLVATEYLQRFAETGVPNRAELSDVALAARQGVDGVVLTKETSGSPFAIESVRLAQRIIEVERKRQV